MSTTMAVSSIEECNRMANALLNRTKTKTAPVDRHIINVEYTIDAHYHEHDYPISMILWAASESHYRREAPHILKIEGNLLEELRCEADSTWVRGKASIYHKFKVVCGRDRIRFRFEVPLTNEWYPTYVRFAWD